MTGVPLRAMITFAYDVRDFQISGGPGWVGTERFDIMARARSAAASDSPADLAKMTDDQRKTVRDPDGRETSRAIGGSVSTGGT